MKAVYTVWQTLRRKSDLVTALSLEFGTSTILGVLAVAFATGGQSVGVVPEPLLHRRARYLLRALRVAHHIVAGARIARTLLMSADAGLLVPLGVHHGRTLPVSLGMDWHLVTRLSGSILCCFHGCESCHG